MARSFLKGKDKFHNIRKLNIFLGTIHLIQSLIIFSVSNSTLVQFNSDYFGLLSGQAAREFGNNSQVLFEVRLSALVALFLFIAALTHFLTTSSGIREWYDKNLKKGIGYARWWEYAFSSSIMIVIIASIVGITNFFTILAIFTLNALMNIFGLIMEKTNSGKKKDYDWTSFIYGVIAGIVPWIIIFSYYFGALSLAIPTAAFPLGGYVIWILVIDFVWFSAFALNMYAGFRKIGPWKNYLYTEVVYSFLSLFSKSILAWQIFLNLLS